MSSPDTLCASTIVKEPMPVTKTVHASIIVNIYLLSLKNGEKESE